ncbi:hypothetical protein DFH08DRAFT_805384 [Mycena albidolilacea]|uniref:Uncharacterized protein n=1 Tax=Mycena albidolilacea TaxID=1033008 RepID=A0AAD7A8J0_9AGAR|nr:hypothetical protein DFH08DRAFT_805384 [Mycena albidolilacea]
MQGEGESEEYTFLGRPPVRTLIILGADGESPADPSLPLADCLQTLRPPILVERLQGSSPMSLASQLVPPAPTSRPPTSVQQLTGSPRQEDAGPLSLADWLATQPNPDTLPRCFAVLLHRDPPAHDGRTYRSPINPEDPTAPQRVADTKRDGRGGASEPVLECAFYSCIEPSLALGGAARCPIHTYQMQDFDEEMDDPLQSWTPDEDDKWGMGPPI